MSGKRLLLCAVLAALSAGARADRNTVTKISVRNQGEVPVRVEQVEAFLHTDMVGQTYDPAVVEKDVKALLDTKLYSYVGIILEESAEGVEVVVAVEARRRLAERLAVEIESDRFDFWTMRNSFWGDHSIRKFAGLTVRDPVDDAMMRTAAAAVAAKYRENGFFDAEVGYRLEPDGANPAVAHGTLVIKEGARRSVALIRFDGNKAVSDSDLRRYSRQHPWYNPLSWFSSERLGTYDLEVVRSDARSQYADLGYLDATVSRPVVTETNGVRRIRYTVEEGVRYRIGKITLEGVSLFPETSLRRAMPVSEGGIASQAAMDAAATAIYDFYGSRGYLDTSVVLRPPVPAPGEEGVVDLTYQVREGKLVRVRSVLVNGNTRTSDKVIRRDIPLNPGEVFSSTLATRGDRRLRNLGYFSSVIHSSQKTDDPEYRDLVYEVEEQPTGNLMMGVAYSSEDHLVGFGEISEKNFDITNWRTFKGAGQKARLGVQLGSDSTDIEASFTEPWFMDRWIERLSLDVNGFWRTGEHSEYDEEHIGGSVGLSRHVPWVGRVGVSFMLEQIELEDVLEGEFAYLDDPSHLYRFTDEDDKMLQGSLKLNWIYDTRDRPMIPTSGTRATAAATYYGEALGSDTEMYSLDFRARTYFRLWWNHVLSFYLRSSVIETFDDGDEVPIVNRYFLGGGRNVRGFKSRAVGPKVLPTDPEKNGTRYRAPGGQTLFQGGVEYSVPLGSVFRLGMFYDIGNVWEDPYDFDFSEYASTVGAGIRIDVPQFPLRLDYTYPVEKDDDISRRQRVVFWVGFD